MILTGPAVRTVGVTSQPSGLMALLSTCFLTCFMCKMGTAHAVQSVCEDPSGVFVALQVHWHRRPLQQRSVTLALVPDDKWTPEPGGPGVPDERADLHGLGSCDHPHYRQSEGAEGHPLCGGGEVRTLPASLSLLNPAACRVCHVATCHSPVTLHSHVTAAGTLHPA